MATKASFDTLLRFQAAIESTEVFVKGKPSVGLTDGLGIAVQHFFDIRKTGNKALFIGNGGSSAIASHQALDLWNHAGIRALAFNDAALLTCMANDFGYENVFARPLEMFCDEGDLLIAISSSGNSENILKAVQAAQKKKCKVIGFSGFKNENRLSQMGELHFYVPSGSYGVVETAHFLLTHSIIDEVTRTTKVPK